MAVDSPKVWQRPLVWLVLGALLLMGLGTTLMLRHRAELRRQAQEQAALPPPQQVKVAALGRIEPASRVIRVGASDTGRLDRLLVKKGIGFRLVRFSPI
ncbi:MAG: hypothetical protein LVS60_17335 [Nodosilinea sp. LVE1205-7]|jgi:HlyD family secretion protein